ncbi:MAG: hypothetical protein GY810_20920 [Aureispira sp.]|nr:hypothetical protein [Aureispira sp.]
MLKIKSFLIFTILISFFSCKKDYSPTPDLEFMEMSKKFMAQNQADSTVLTFSFVDGDGDIGDDATDNIYIRDSRTDGLIGTYRMPNYATTNSDNYRKGTVSIVVKSPCCIYPDSSSCYASTVHPIDTMRFTIQVQDRSGKWSNTIQSDLVQLDCI